MYAEIAVNAPVDKTFDYHIPPELEGKLLPGHLVQVPFGAGMQHGVVMSLRDLAPPYQTRAVAARLDPRPALTEDQIELACWLSRTYLTPVGPCLWLLLPPGITGGRDIRVTLLDDNVETKDEVEAALVALLRRRGPLRGSQLNQALRGQLWRPAVDALAKTGAVQKEHILKAPTARPRTAQVVALAIHPEEIDRALSALARPSRRADVLETILQFDGAVLRTRGNRASVNKLVEQGLVSVGEDETIALRVSRETALATLDQLRGLEKPRRILRVLAREGQPVDMSWVYAQTDATLNDLRRLEAESLVSLGAKDQWRDSLAEREFIPVQPPALTPEQAAAWEEVRAAILGRGQARRSPAGRGDMQGEREPVFLLHGVTGSGKTEIYLRAIELTLELGRAAIFLVPEIALTAQTVRRVASRFAGQVAVVHSALSIGERYDTWRRAREGRIGVVVGARSALFTPLPDVGLIVLDEEHDHSYKQAESGVGFPQPYYHARQVAEEMIYRNHGVLILGSATPDLETSYRARRGEITYLQMPSRIMGHRANIQAQAQREGVAAHHAPAATEDAVTIDLPPVDVVDMREELKAGNTSIFSRALQEALAATLRRQEQAILFINRRGQSTYVFCRDCGYVATCPRCDSPLTHHRQGQALRCHRCGYEQPEPSTCPQCRSKRIKFFGAGTQQVEQVLRERFPQARLVRWDSDTAASPEAHEKILQRFVDRRADILIGTQMVAKGLDLPMVTLVGVVSADLGLALPDFRAGERTFQTLTQVAGRAGRGLLGGRVVLQTYQPAHYVIAAASRHDYSAFYAREIAYRHELGYPPFRRLVRLIFRFPGEDKARAEAERAAAMLRQRIQSLNLTGTELIGPAPCFFTKVNRFYRWHLLLRGPDPSVALQNVDFPKGWHVDVDPVDVL